MNLKSYQQFSFWQWILGLKQRSLWGPIVFGRIYLFVYLFLVPEQQPTAVRSLLFWQKLLLLLEIIIIIIIIRAKAVEVCVFLRKAVTMATCCFPREQSYFCGSNNDWKIMKLCKHIRPSNSIIFFIRFFCDFFVKQSSLNQEQWHYCRYSICTTSPLQKSHLEPFQNLTRSLPYLFFSSLDLFLAFCRFKKKLLESIWLPDNCGCFILRCKRQPGKAKLILLNVVAMAMQCLPRKMMLILMVWTFVKRYEISWWLTG